MTRNEAIKQIVVVGAMAVIPVGLVVYFISLPLNLPLFVLALISVLDSLVIGFISLWMRAATEKGKDE